jgi:tubulin monoglycylase TTLL3/8
MLDDNFNPWLIEVNESPSMEYSTDITERLVKELFPSIVSVVVDWAWTPPRRRH